MNCERHTVLIKNCVPRLENLTHTSCQLAIHMFKIHVLICSQGVLTIYFANFLRRGLYYVQEIALSGLFYSRDGFGRSSSGSCPGS